MGCLWAWCALGAFWWHMPPRPAPPDGGWFETGRIIDEDDLHLGARPHSDDVGDVAVTVQVTVRTPW